MKRYLFITVLTLWNLLAIAASPKLASEKIFEDIDLYDPSLSITMMEQKNQTVRTLSFKNKPDLFKKIKKALDADKEKACSKSFVSDNGEISESIIIDCEDDEIKIGLNNSRTKEVYFFMQIIHKNNSNNIKSTKNSKNSPTKKASRSVRTSKSTSKSKRTSKSEKRIKSNELQNRIYPLLEEQLLSNDSITETSVIYYLSDL